jgi:hypothetical protein
MHEVVLMAVELHLLTESGAAVGSRRQVPES